MVRVVRLERTVSWSQTRRDTNFAIPGYSISAIIPQQRGESKFLVIHLQKNNIKITTQKRTLQFAKSFRLVEVTGFEPAASWSQTKRATICATPRCSVLKAGVSHKTYYTPEGEKMSSIGAYKNALTNPAQYGTVNAQTRNSTIRARLPG